MYTLLFFAILIIQKAYSLKNAATYEKAAPCLVSNSPTCGATRTSLVSCPFALRALQSQESHRGLAEYMEKTLSMLPGSHCYEHAFQEEADATNAKSTTAVSTTAMEIFLDTIQKRLQVMDPEHVRSIYTPTKVDGEAEINYNNMTSLIKNTQTPGITLNYGHEGMLWFHENTLITSGRVALKLKSPSFFKNGQFAGDKTINTWYVVTPFQTEYELELFVDNTVKNMFKMSDEVDIKVFFPGTYADKQFVEALIEGLDDWQDEASNNANQESGITF